MYRRGFATSSLPACESCLPPQSGRGETGGARLPRGENRGCFRDVMGTDRPRLLAPRYLSVRHLSYPSTLLHARLLRTRARKCQSSLSASSADLIREKKKSREKKKEIYEQLLEEKEKEEKDFVRAQWIRNHGSDRGSIMLADWMQTEKISNCKLVSSFFKMFRRYMFLVQQHIRVRQRLPRKDYDPQRRRRRGVFTDGRKSLDSKEECCPPVKIRSVSSFRTSRVVSSAMSI